MSVAAASTTQLTINTIRTLSMDAVQKANSGHPGTPMALAPVAYELWNRHLRFDPQTPFWPARDRFVLSCGHASMLLYSILHLAQVRKADGSPDLAITLENIENFRQLHSPCAGHPEFGDAAGIETTTGPLGQGVATSVGMAAAAQWKAARFNRPGYDLFGYNIYALCSDGDLMEGISSEAASLAGHLKLANLCWIYDDNHITIEGDTDLAFNEDVARRFEGHGWHVIKVADANDLAALDRAMTEFQSVTDKPTLIIVRSIIGYGSPHKANSHEAHGAPLGEDEIRATKEVYGWDPDAHFLVPAEAIENFAEGIGTRGHKICEEWQKKYSAFKQEFPQIAAEWEQFTSGKLPAGWDANLPTFATDAKGLATRVSSGQLINAIAAKVPWFLGGSADLAPSTNTLIKDKTAGSFEADNYAGRNFHFGIREHGMAAAANGMSLSGLRPYVATFFVFSDYLRPAMRLSCIMRRPVLYVFTHDSIGLGEDGTTHQPIEHLAACRAMPRLIVLRPGDANEVAEAYRAVLQINDHPVAMILSRQNVPTLDRSKYASAAGTAKGAYILADAKDGKPDVILLGTGTELSIAVTAYEKLTAEGIKARVVSIPSFELFEMQDEAYKNSVLPPSVTARVAVEAGLRQGWDKYLGTAGRFVGMTDFGHSAPAPVLYKYYGITADHVAEEAKGVLGKK